METEGLVVWRPDETRARAFAGAVTGRRVDEGWEWVGVSADLPDGASVAQTRAGAMRWLAVALNLTTMERPVSFTITAVKNGTRVDTVLVEVGETDDLQERVLAGMETALTRLRPAIEVGL